MFEKEEEVFASLILPFYPHNFLLKSYSKVIVINLLPEIKWKKKVNFVRQLWSHRSPLIGY